MEGMKNWIGTAVAGLNSKATRTVRGAISFNSSTHLPPTAGSLTVKPVMLPPGCARFAAKPLPIGSVTDANTIGIVFVSRARAAITGVVTPKIASGRRSTSSFVNVLILSGSAALQRSSIRRLLPSVHPNFASAARNVASQDCAVESLSSKAISTPISRIRSGCCARVASGHVTAEPTTTLLKSRRRITAPRFQEHADTNRLHQGITTGEMGFSDLFARQQSRAAHVRFGSKADMTL